MSKRRVTCRGEAILEKKGREIIAAGGGGGETKGEREPKLGREGKQRICGGKLSDPVTCFNSKVPT